MYNHHPPRFIPERMCCIATIIPYGLDSKVWFYSQLSRPNNQIEIRSSAAAQSRRTQHHHDDICKTHFLLSFSQLHHSKKEGIFKVVMEAIFYSVSIDRDT